MSVAILVAENGDRFEFDAEMPGSTYTMSNDVTSVPIALQTPVNEHIQPLQDTFTVTLRVIDPRTTLNANPGLVIDRFADAFAFFDRNRTQVFTYYSPLYGERRNLVFVSVPYPRSNIGHVDFTVDFRVIERAEFTYIVVPKERKKKPKLEDKKDKGEAGKTQKAFEPQTSPLRALNWLDKKTTESGMGGLWSSDKRAQTEQTTMAEWLQRAKQFDNDVAASYRQNTPGPTVAAARSLK